MDKKKKSKASVRKIFQYAMPPICNAFGVLLLLVVLAIAMPLSLPRLFGFDIYAVISPSMSPEIPMGSIVYAKEIAPEDIQPEDVIVYQSVNDTVTHRVVENRVVEGEIITKGDANAAVDAAVPYQNVIGKVQYHLSFYGDLVPMYNSILGKIYLIGFGLVGVLLNVLASRLRDRNDELEDSSDDTSDTEIDS